MAFLPAIHSEEFFTLLDPDNIENLLRTHAAEIVGAQNLTDQIAIEGKALRGSKTLNSKCAYIQSAHGAMKIA